MLAKALATMKTFSKFDQADLDLFTDEEEYTEYKSWYLTFYDEQKAKANVKTIFADIEFNSDNEKMHYKSGITMLQNLQRQMVLLPILFFRF